MQSKEEKAKYDIDYAKKHLKRIPLDVQKEKYEEIAAAAKQAGIPVNRYIKNAIDEKMEREKPVCSKPAAVSPQDTSSVDLSRLLTDISYQFTVRDAFGSEVLEELMQKARTEAPN